MQILHVKDLEDSDVIHKVHCTTQAHTTSAVHSAIVPEVFSKVMAIPECGAFIALLIGTCFSRCECAILCVC